MTFLHPINETLIPIPHLMGIIIARHICTVRYSSLFDPTPLFLSFLRDPKVRIPHRHLLTTTLFGTVVNVFVSPISHVLDNMIFQIVFVRENGRCSIAMITGKVNGRVRIGR
uniref:Uncharacterized protein n=1 Tax=Cacopsylla melanoneura TaxID=428564 RepID=A0A8D8VQV7_9HEMI